MPVVIRHHWLAASLLGVTWGYAFPASARTDPPRLFGLVIGYNGSDDPAQAPLRYADDDAVKNAQLLKDLGADYVLLTDLDADTRRLYPDVETTLPTHGAFATAIERLNERMLAPENARRAHHLLVFYAGHGDVSQNEGFVHLADGHLSRTELRELLSLSKADVTHVIVDACKSYFLVFDRGPGGERRPALGQMPNEVASFPDNMGFLLSTSSAADTHEWEALQSGVFSHEVRSALRGAADLDGDGKISYEEAAAFIFAANRMIPNARYRPAVFARAPGGAELSKATIVDIGDRSDSRLRVGPGVDEHLYVEDSRGNRISDLHPSSDLVVDLVLPASRPVFVREARTAREYQVDQAGIVALARISPRAQAATLRGAEHVAFSLLFSEAYGKSSIVAYAADAELEALQSPTTAWPPAWLGNTMLVGTGVLAASGGALTGLAVSQRRHVNENTSNLKRIAANHRIDRYNVGAVVLYSLAASSLATYLILKLWPQDEVRVEVSNPGPMSAVSP